MMNFIIDCCKVEVFKSEQSTKDALHSRFNVYDGSEVEGADEVGQLQICAISVYLLTLVQMITSNLEVCRENHSNNINVSFYLRLFSQWMKSILFNN